MRRFFLCNYFFFISLHFKDKIIIYDRRYYYKTGNY